MQGSVKDRASCHESAHNQVSIRARIRKYMRTASQPLSCADEKLPGGLNGQQSPAVVFNNSCYLLAVDCTLETVRNLPESSQFLLSHLGLQTTFSTVGQTKLRPLDESEILQRTPCELASYPACDIPQNSELGRYERSRLAICPTRPVSWQVHTAQKILLHAEVDQKSGWRSRLGIEVTFIHHHQFSSATDFHLVESPI